MMLPVVKAHYGKPVAISPRVRHIQTLQQGLLEEYIRDQDVLDERTRSLSCKRASQADQVILFQALFMVGTLSFHYKDEANDVLMFAFGLSAGVFTIFFFSVLSIAKRQIEAAMRCS